MKHAASQELYIYWRGLCRGRTAPERTDIDPAAIRGILADTIMVEITGIRTSVRSFPIRLSGTRITALFGENVKGCSLVDLWRQQDRTAIADLIESVLDNSQPAVAGGVAAPPGCDPLGLELLLLPLRHQGRTHVRLLGALSPASIPSWLGLMPVNALSLTSHRMIDFAADRRWVARGEEPGPSSTGDRLRRAVRRGHFVVYEGGRQSEPRVASLLRAR